MLPGFRFLLLAIVLSISMMIFGLGAASLLRTAHQEFVSLPTRLAAPETILTPAPDTPPRLAMLSVEARTPDDEVGRADAPTSAGLASAETSQQATLSPPDRTTDSPSVTASTTDTTPTAEASPGGPTTPEVQASTKTAAATPLPEIMPAAPDVTTPVDATGSITPPPTPDPASPASGDISLQIATLGGPPVDISPVPLPVAKPVARPTRNVGKRTSKRRRVAAREPPAVPRPADAAATTSELR